MIVMLTNRYIAVNLICDTFLYQQLLLTYNKHAHSNHDMTSELDHFIPSDFAFYFV